MPIYYFQRTKIGRERRIKKMEMYSLNHVVRIRI